MVESYVRHWEDQSVGTEIERERFTDADFAAFRDRLRDGLVALEQVLARPGFEDIEALLDSLQHR